jgi:hypothetical protein
LKICVFAALTKFTFSEQGSHQETDECIHDILEEAQSFGASAPSQSR